MKEKRPDYRCRNCGEGIIFYMKHGSMRNVWLHRKTNESGCDLQAEPEAAPVKSRKQRCRYPENGGGGHVEYCMMVLKLDGTCPEHGQRGRQS